MRKMKKALAVGLSLTMVAACFAGCGKTNSASSGNTAKGTTGGKTFRIAVWNDEFQTRFNDYYASKLPADVKLEWVVNPNDGGVYQAKLDEALMKQASLPAEARIDMFCIEADAALKYINTDYTLDVKKDIGLKDDDLKNMYQYTKDIVTTANGALKGVSWQSCPQGFLYRRSMAKAVLGTDDPDEVQKQISDWDKFDAVAAKMKEAGNFMLSGYDDDYRVFANNAKNPWVDGTKIQVDDQIKKWVKQTKEYTEKGYNNKASLWSPESQAQMAKDGKVFGYFGPAWFMDYNFLKFTLDDEEGAHEVGNGGYGDWGMVKGPQGSYWGGTWICGATGTDNIDIVKDVMLTMTCDKETLLKIVADKGDFCNSVEAMTEIANSDYGYDFLGGQNHIKTLLESAQDIHISSASNYDLTMTEKIQGAMKDYFDGNITEDEAWEQFYTNVLNTHPELTR